MNLGTCSPALDIPAIHGPDHYLDRLWPLSDPAGDDRRFRDNIFRQLPEPMLEDVTAEYEHTCKTLSKGNANLKLLSLFEKAKGKFPIYRVYSNSCIKDLAERLKNLAWELDSPFTADAVRYRRLSEFVSSYNIPPPQLKPELGYAPVLKRFSCIKWWKQQTKKAVLAELEEVYRYMGKVRQQAGKYISEPVLKIILDQQRMNSEYVELMELENEDGDRLSLKDVRDASIANPEIRRNELMVRLRGTEEYAKEMNHVGLFLTLTTPSRMHPFRATGIENPKYDQTTARQAHEYLCKLFTQIRAELARRGATYYGIRVVEPHHDGTPHWHFLIFLPQSHQNGLLAVFKEYAHRDSKGEEGAAKHRFKADPIDKSKGSATGYIAKYISKNINGFGLDTENDGSIPKENAIRAKAWACLNGIRQFQMFGQPPVTVWRELRRLREVLDNPLEPFRHAADSGDWKTFFILTGGHNCPAKDRPLQLLRQWSDQPTAYGEPRGYSIIGVTLGPLEIPTRFHTWQLVRTGQPKADLETIYRKAAGTDAYSKAEDLLVPRPRFSALGDSAAIADATALGTAPFSSLEFCQ